MVKYNINKKQIIVCIVVLIVLLAFIYVRRQQRLRNFMSYDSMDSVCITNESTGKQVEIVDRYSLNEIATFLQNLTVKRTITLPSEGYSYYMDIYDGNNIQTRIKFISEHLINIDGNWYGLKNKNACSIGDFFSKLIKKY